MARGAFRLFLGLAVCLSVLAACSKGDEEGGGSDEGGTVKCEGTALSSDEINLPSDFPIPSEAVLTTSSKDGPSQVVEGYYEADIQSAYNEWKDALDQAQYAILFDELEEKDSEISYRSPDSSSTGQIALRADCEETDRTSVHITNRPA